MKLFLDSSVMLAAIGSRTGASRFLFDHASEAGWRLVTAAYCMAEVEINLPDVMSSVAQDWGLLRMGLSVLPDAWTDPRPFLLTAAKDKPVLFAALAHHTDTLLTLDKRDFKLLLGTPVYGMWVLTPGDFLRRERSLGRLR